jgi:hypothetical protein
MFSEYSQEHQVQENCQGKSLEHWQTVDESSQENPDKENCRDHLKTAKRSIFRKIVMLSPWNTAKFRKLWR